MGDVNKALLTEAGCVILVKLVAWFAAAVMLVELKVAIVVAATVVFRAEVTVLAKRPFVSKITTIITFVTQLGHINAMMAIFSTVKLLVWVTAALYLFSWKKTAGCLNFITYIYI